MSGRAALERTGVRASLVTAEHAASTCGSVTAVSATGPTAAAAVAEVRGPRAGAGLDGQAAPDGDDPAGPCCWLPADGNGGGWGCAPVPSQ